MSVLLITQVFPPRTGGSGRWFWELYRRLTDLNVHVVAGEAPGSAGFDSEAPLPITRLALDLPNWGLAHPGGAPHYVRRLIELDRVVKRVSPDVIHCGKALPEGLLGYAISLWRGVPFLVYAHGEELTLAETSRELRFLTRTVLKAAKSIIANSDHTKHLLTSHWGVDERRITVLHPGVDTAKFVPAGRDSGVREQLGWGDRRVILTVGTLQKRKGQDMLIRSLPEICRDVPDVLYAISGQPLEREYLERLVDELGVRRLVQFRGAPSDTELVQCYQQCDLFALPNRRVGWDIEGFGIVSIEAQACGKPVLVGASGGAPETVKSGITGEIVDCDRPDDLARMAVRLLQDADRRAAMGASARQWVVDQFAWDVLAPRARMQFAH